jgi:hypothetical protein
MPSSHCASPRPRSRRARFATLLALLSLAAGAQGLAPASAGAMVGQGSGQSLCSLVGGSWRPPGAWGAEGCYVLDGGGSPIRVSEFSIGSGTAPRQPNVTPGSGLPNQVGADGAGSGDEKSPKSGSKGTGPGDVKALPDDKKKDKAKDKKPKPPPAKVPAISPQQQCAALFRRTVKAGKVLTQFETGMTILYEVDVFDVNMLTPKEKRIWHKWDDEFFATIREAASLSCDKHAPPGGYKPEE